MLKNIFPSSILRSTFYILNSNKRPVRLRGKNRAPENRSGARFLGKRSGRRSGQGGKRSAPPAMAPWRDEPQRGETAASMPRNFARQRTAGFPFSHGKFFCQLKRIFVNQLYYYTPNAQKSKTFNGSSMDKNAARKRGAARLLLREAFRAQPFCARRRRSRQTKTGDDPSPANMAIGQSMAEQSPASASTVDDSQTLPSRR